MSILELSPSILFVVVVLLPVEKQVMKVVVLVEKLAALAFS